MATGNAFCKQPKRRTVRTGSTRSQSRDIRTCELDLGGLPRRCRSGTDPLDTVLDAEIGFSARVGHPKYHNGGLVMGLSDKIGNKSEELAGKAKEGVGRATGDEELENQGKGDQLKGNLKEAAEKVKDAFKK